MDALESTMAIWGLARQLTYDFLDRIAGENLVRHCPRPALDQIGKQLLEMGDVTLAYAEGLRTGTISFEKVRWEFPRSEVGDKARLRSHLSRSDAALQSALEIAMSKPQETYELGGERLSLQQVMIWLALHETLHHGQLIAYSYLLRTGFPVSWIDQWALPSEEKE